ncbi:YkoY family integral membrane protein [Mucilaginibacter gracilis]|uniref:YkoY family integral membrane protein n=1 Tax=Mucilaginibacter gracilis TaxID=423350 RepID=A0A495J474_9SPHI|nr:TerC family protein [Mucilaginibacter gracilis]RKR83785.1 YkoY family integral membrane protein [Mucilaginibacter gracilis]
MDFLHTLLGPDIKAGLLIILNLIVIESLLSVDNAAVLATMVIDLPKEQRAKALRYGIIGAYVLRGVCLFLASWLVKIWWLKPIGGLYLMYLAFNYFKGKIAEAGGGEDESVDKSQNWLYKSTVGVFGIFWATVAIVELMDLAFSIDNVFAAVAFTDHVFLIYTGVFIGILAMRFVAQAFVKLMEKFTFLETVAFVVIGVLGIKLTASIYIHFYPDAAFSKMMEGEKADIFVSVFTVAIFVIPVITSLLFNYPKKNIIEPEVAEAAEDVLDKS